MYIYFNESLEPTTIIPHGEILRQGGDLNLYLCFDKEIDGSLFCYINNDKNIGVHKYVPFYNYIEFNKIKDSEITYDLVDGESYYVYKTKFLPDEATQQHGELKISFEIVQGMEYEIIDCEFKIINPGNLLKTSTVVLYVEKTFGYATQNVDISNIEYQDLIRLIGGVAADKASFSDAIFVTSFDEIVLSESNLNRLFIDRINGNICKIIKKENIFEKKIINLGLDGLNLFLSEKTDETPIKDSDNFVNSGGIFDAIDEIPVVNPIGEKSGLEGIKVDEEEYIIPQTEFELIANEDGKLTNIKIGKESYDVDTLDNLEVSTDIKYGDTKPITGGAVYDALEELPDIEIETVNGIMMGGTYNGTNFDVPLVDLEIYTTATPSNAIPIVGLKIGNNSYYIASSGGGTVLVDSYLDSSSTNPVQNKVIYTALNAKVVKEEGKGLSEQNYTELEKTKLANLPDNTTLTNMLDNKVNVDGYIAFTTAEKTKLAGLSNYNDSELRSKITSIENVLSVDDESLDTLQELVDVITNDETGLASIVEDLSGKVDKVTGKGLSTNDFTNAYKDKLDNLESTINNAITNVITDAINNSY